MIIYLVIGIFNKNYIEYNWGCGMWYFVLWGVKLRLFE